MKIIDLNEENQHLYFVCLEDWSDEMQEAGNHKEEWFHKMKDKGLGVKLALDDNGVVGGMIQYVPIEYSPAMGEDLYFINCIWVHGYNKGRGNFRKQGMGKALLAAAEEDVKKTGAKGIVAYGLSFPVWMRASWFKKRGYEKVDTQKGMVLLWKKFLENAKSPMWMDRFNKKQLPENDKKVYIAAFKNGWCPAANIVYERAKRAASEYKDQIEFQTFDTSDISTMRRWCTCDAVIVDGKSIRMGPPASYRQISKIIKRKVKQKFKSII